MDVSSGSSGVNHKNYILTHEPVEFWEKGHTLPILEHFDPGSSYLVKFV